MSCYVIRLLAFLNAWDACCIELALILPGTQWNGSVQHQLNTTQWSLTNKPAAVEKLRNRNILCHLKIPLS